MQESGFYSRGYLPHLHVPGATQFLTWRLHDSIPSGLVENWRRSLAGDPEARGQLYRQVDRYLDEGHGSCWLKRSDLACAVMDELIEYEGHVLHAAVVMPNHVHAVVTPNAGLPLQKVMQQLKGASAYKINLKLGRTGPLWQADYFDRVVRGPEHFQKCVDYIHWNPVRAGLVEHPAWFMASTAHERYAAGLKPGDPDAG